MKMEPKRKPYKPLKWRTGPVEEDIQVLYREETDICRRYGLGCGFDGDIEDEPRLIPHKEARWLPLSEILELVEDNDG